MTEIHPNHKESAEFVRLFIEYTELLSMGKPALAASIMRKMKRDMGKIINEYDQIIPSYERKELILERLDKQNKVLMGFSKHLRSMYKGDDPHIKVFEYAISALNEQMKELK